MKVVKKDNKEYVYNYRKVTIYSKTYFMIKELKDYYERKLQKPITNQKIINLAISKIWKEKIGDKK